MRVYERDLTELTLHAHCQPRLRIDLQVVEEYRQLIEQGLGLPPIVVFGHYVADGWHRWTAHLQAGRKKINCITYEGGLKEAILYSAGANANHGLRRTIADKRRAVQKLLATKPYADWSNRKIAAAAKVSHPFVANCRSGNVSMPNSKEIAISARPKRRARRSDPRALRIVEQMAVAKAPKALTEPQRTRLHDALPQATHFLDTLRGLLSAHCEEAQTAA